MKQVRGVCLAPSSHRMKRNLLALRSVPALLSTMLGEPQAQSRSLLVSFQYGEGVNLLFQ